MIRYRKISVTTIAVSAALFAHLPVFAQTITSPFNANYTITDIGSALTVPASYGGMTFLNASTLLIAGNADRSSGAIYEVNVTRNGTGHITGFSGAPSLYSTAPGISGNNGIDGGLVFGPGSDLFYTSYSDNSIGEIKPGSSAPNKHISLSSLGIPASTGALYIVPSGFAGAGELKVVTYGSGEWFSASLAPDGSGTYNITNVTQPYNPNSSFHIVFPSSGEGFVYVHAGNPNFSADSILIAGSEGVDSYQVNASGDPILSTGRYLASISGAEGTAFDPVTGDLLVDTYGYGNQIMRISGFNAPHSTPEPGTLGLVMGSALAGAAVVLRRRQR